MTPFEIQHCFEAAENRELAADGRVAVQMLLQARCAGVKRDDGQPLAIKHFIPDVTHARLNARSVLREVVAGNVQTVAQARPEEAAALAERILKSPGRDIDAAEYDRIRADWLKHQELVAAKS